MHPDGKEAKNALNISQRIFNLKLDIVCELQKNEHQENSEHKQFYEKYKEIYHIKSLWRYYLGYH